MKRYTLSDLIDPANLADWLGHDGNPPVIEIQTKESKLDRAQEIAENEGANAYRHFDLEILNALFKSKREGIVKGMNAEEVERRDREKAESVMAAWLEGKDVRPYFYGAIRLRIKGGFVECSNGNKVSLQSALKTLPFVHRYRDKGWQSNGQVHDIDAFRIERIDKDGVAIGCTQISWEEIDRFTPILKKARKANR